MDKYLKSKQWYKHTRPSDHPRWFTNVFISFYYTLRHSYRESSLTLLVNLLLGQEKTWYSLIKNLLPNNLACCPVKLLVTLFTNMHDKSQQINRNEIPRSLLPPLENLQWRCEETLPVSNSSRACYLPELTRLPIITPGDDNLLP